MNTYSGMVNTHSGNDPKSVHVQPGMSVHDGPEYANSGWLSELSLSGHPFPLDASDKAVSVPLQVSWLWNRAGYTPGPLSPERGTLEKAG